MSLFTDQLGRRIELKRTPERIISVVPSQTELLFDLGLDEEVIGITKFCVHPHAWFISKQRIGGTKTLNIEKIKSLAPDLIIANKEENDREQIEELAEIFPVWVSDVNNLEDAYDMLNAIGNLTNKKETAAALVTRIRTSFFELQTTHLTAGGFAGTVGQTEKLRTAYLIWKDPYMAVGGGTFIHDMMIQAGFENIFEYKDRYPEINIDDLQFGNCQLLILSSEPYPFKEKHCNSLAAQLPGTKIILADGEIFSWYGSRLQYAPAYLKSLHQEITAML